MFDGINCELELDACSTRPDPCDLEGSIICESLNPMLNDPPFECICKIGYFGRKCETSLCDTASPCLNEATCSMTPTGDTLESFIKN